MRKLADADYREFADLLRTPVAARGVGWIDDNESDPGLALIDLFGFLTEQLLLRADPIQERGRSTAARLAKFALALADPGASVAAGTLERPRYFSGQLLGADDFQLEQDYFRARLRRLNRALLGFGVVSGLGVSVQPGNSGAGAQVVITPGFALDPLGEEIEVCDAQTVALPPDGRGLYVVLLHAERPTHPQPAANGQEFTRIEERFAIRLDPVPADDAVTLARLLLEDRGWRVDQDFTPVRVTRCAT
jgi:hypothetical protein